MTKDTDIISAIHADRERGFRLLVGQYAQAIYWHVRRTIGRHDDAEDITQEVFVRAYKNIDTLRDPALLRSWLYRIASNEAVRFVEKRRTEYLSLDSASRIEADEYINYSDLEAIHLKQAIDSLPPRQRVAFNLRYYDDMDYDEIASVMDTTVTTARANYHYAKERIVQYMKSLND